MLVFNLAPIGLVRGHKCQVGDLAAVAAGVDTSCKTAFIMRLLAELVAKGHRTLIFSQSRVMLDILQAAISQHSYRFRRIDGSISSATERQVSHCCEPKQQLKSVCKHAYPLQANNTAFRES